VVRLRSGLDWLGALTSGRMLDPDPLGEKGSGAEQDGERQQRPNLA
jgi:hypothetical protein